MSDPPALSHFPDRLPRSLKHRHTVYVKDETRFAVSGHPPLGGMTPLYTLCNDEIAVFEHSGDLPEGLPGGALVPVYKLQSSGAPFVPTGRVWIAFSSDVQVEQRIAAIENAGYLVEEIPDWAPCGAWLRHRSRRVVDTLMCLPRLESLNDIEEVEPQMLTQRALRHGPPRRPGGS